MFYKILKHDQTFFTASAILNILWYEILTFDYSFRKAMYYSTADYF